MSSSVIIVKLLAFKKFTTYVKMAVISRKKYCFIYLREVVLIIIILNAALRLFEKRFVKFESFTNYFLNPVFFLE